jgi:hypothetical protein
MWFDDSDRDFKFPLVAVLITDATFGETKNSRKGFPHCLRIDIKLRPQSDLDDICACDLGLAPNVDKVVLGFAEQRECAKWLAALDWALKRDDVIEKHIELKFGKSSAPAPAPAPAPVVDAEAMRRKSIALARDEMEAEEQALAREQERLAALNREAKAAAAHDQEEARRVAIQQKLEQENRELQHAAGTQAPAQPPESEEDRKEAQRTHAVKSAGNASTVDEAELALARMERMYLQPQPAASTSHRGSISAEEWTSERSKLVAKIACLKGTEAWKFARDKILKQKWQVPALKTLVAPGKGFIAWTGRKPVRYVRVASGPSEQLNLLM